MADEPSPETKERRSVRSREMGYRRSGMTTGTFQTVAGLISSDRDRDAKQQGLVVKVLGGLLALSLVVNGILVAGIVGVGVTGKVPGIGEIQIVQPRE